MKRRLLSLVLAASMTLGSLNVAFADESVSMDPETAVEETVVDDEVESDAAVEADVVDASAEDGTYGPYEGPDGDLMYWQTSGYWKAAVYGDVGGEEKIANLGNPNAPESVGYKKDEAGNYIYTYDVAEDGKNVNMRMGIPAEDPTVSGIDSQGKIASGTEGRVLYYQKLTADDDFTINATAHINGLNYNNQVSFGAMVMDKVEPFVQSKALPADSVNVGVRQMLNASKDGIGSMNFAWVRNAGTIEEFKPADDTTLTLPAPGQDIKIQLKKSGTTYTLKFGDQKVEYDGSALSMTDDIYAGIYVSRCADVTFKNVSMSVVGRKVELPEWANIGNGIAADSDKIKDTALSGDSSAFEMSLATDNGKFSNGEDGYAFYAVQAPSAEDFKVNATIDSMTINPASNPNQAGAGFLVADEHYGKNNPPEGVPGKSSFGASLFVGVMSPDKVNLYPVYRIRKPDGKIVLEKISEASLGPIGSTVGPFDIMVSRSGDNFKVKFGDNDAIDIPTSDTEGLFENNQYIGYALARTGSIKVSKNDLSVGTKKVASLSIASMPEKTDYYSTEKVDVTGLALDVVYTDGTGGTVTNPDDYSLIGFDNATEKYFETPGERVLKAQIGKASVDIPINVRAKKVTSISIDYAPNYDTYYEGGKFNTDGLQVTATFEDGSSKKLKSSEYLLKIGDKVIDSKTTVTSDLAGEDVAVVVTYTDQDITIDPNGMSDVFNVTIKPGKLSEIRTYTKDFKTIYYVGQSIYAGSEELDNIHVPGLSIDGIYVDSNGQQSVQYIAPSFYEVVDEATGKPFPTFTAGDVGTKTVRIQLKEDPSIFTTYTIQVQVPTPIMPEAIGYPRRTYAQNEAFSSEGMSFGVLYTDNTTIALCEDAFFYKNGTEYYKVYNKDVTDETGAVVATAGQRVDITEADVLAADFYIDLTDFNTSVVGQTVVSVVLNSRFGVAAAAPTVWTVTVNPAVDYVWKASLFGASSLGVKADDDSSVIVANYADGTSARSDKDVHEIKPELMENGKLDNISSVDVTSWGGAGKISGDQDGIAYYYTKVDANNNFSISADVTVKRYIQTLDNLTPEQKATYDGYIKAGDTPEIALDKLRSGQEAFGIMARDIIPYAGGVDAEGTYLGGATNHMTPVPEKAIKTTYEFTKDDNSTVSYETGADLYEAFMNKLTVTDANGINYSVTRANVETQFTSNIVIAGGCTDSTWPTDPNSSSYTKKTLMNRINIMTRVGVVDPSVGAGNRVAIYSTTNSLPVAGDKYNIKLTKMNTGYMITTYDYQTGDTSTKYSFDSFEETENVLETQDSNNIYVGFFASRYADINVANIELHETNPATDPIITASVDEAVAPKVTVSSPYYTTSQKYYLLLKSNSTKGMTGGVATISMNGKTLREGTIIGNREQSYEVNLVPNSVNRFSVVYYPNTADDFLSYDPVITRFNVTHCSVVDTKKIYVSPAGTPVGDGTRENPINLETALGIVDFGGEIIMLDGTYVPTNADLGKIEMPSTYSGAANGSFKTLRAEEGTRPVVDLQKKFAGFDCDADYWYFKGFDVCNSKDNEKAFGLAGMHCVVDSCSFYNNGTTGFQISRINSKDALIQDWPSYNVVKSCESFNNCDPSKNNADGFGSKLTVGYGNVFEDCISHHNLDDGWDCYTKVNTGVIGRVVLENCVSYKQGYQLLADGTDADYNATSGGNGFKLGGEGLYVEHYLKDCITFYNKASGVDTNNNPALIGRNVVAFNNNEINFSLYSNTASSLSVDGSSMDENGEVYKFNYDFVGAISAGDRSIDKLSSVNYETNFANAAVHPLLSEENFLKVGSFTVYEDNAPDKPSDYYKKPAKNSADVELDESKVFKSTDPTTAYGTTQRYERAEDGSFIHGDFLALVEPYKHEAADIVTLPDVYGNKGGVGVGSNPEQPSEVTTTETTTKRPSVGGGGGGGGSSATKTTTTTVATTEATTEATTSAVEDKTEATTEAPVLTANIKVTIGSTDIDVNGNVVAMDVAPYIQTASNSTMVPLRFVALAIVGGDVEDADNSDLILWDAVAKTATITAGDNAVVFTAGSATFTANGIELPVANGAIAEIRDNRMFVPFRTIGEALGAEVSWDGETKTAMYN